MFTSEITLIPNSIQYSAKFTFNVWGSEFQQQKTVEYIVSQRKTAYEFFIKDAADYLRWTSDYLYIQLQQIRKYYFDSTSVPYFGNAQKNWAITYWTFLESRDRVRQFPYSEKELAKSFALKQFGGLIPIYQFPERAEIKECVATIEKLCREILAAIRQLQKEVSLPISA